MKFCIAVSEFNPLHNGHALFLENCRKLSGADAVICVMSGNFTQRGDTAALNKTTRAKHAVLAGADAVIELPSVFAAAPSEIFARGAVHILKYLPGADSLCFGSEWGDAGLFKEAAGFFIDEPQSYKNKVKEILKSGESLSFAREKALKDICPQYIPLLSAPNNILGLEYTKAVIRENLNVRVVTYKREGGYNDKALFKSPSATAVRESISKGAFPHLKGFVPQFVFSDLPAVLPDAGDLIFTSLLKKNKKELSRIADCSEGLENRIYAALKESGNYGEFLNKVKTKRYPMSRLKRIGLNALLDIDKGMAGSALNKTPYLKVLAVKRGSLDILSVLSRSDAPVITRKTDEGKLKKYQRKIFEKDVLAGNIYKLLDNQPFNEFFTLIV